MSPLFIGLGHYKRTGKDTFANFLVTACAEFNCAPGTIGKQSFAYKLKQVCHELYAWAGLREPEYYDTKTGEQFRESILPVIRKSPRQIWIDMGTKAVRERVYEDTWLNYLLRTDHALSVVVIPDVRFPNEAQAIHDAGGILIKVVRPGFGPGQDVADQALVGYDGWDYVIGGDAASSESLPRLRAWAHEFADWIVNDAHKPSQTLEDRRRNLAGESLL